MADIEGKSSAILCLLKVLQEHSSSDHPLTNKQVIDYLQSGYSITITPNTLRAHIGRLTMMGYEISTFEDNGRGLYLERDEEYDDEEVRVLIDSVLTSRYIPEKQAQQLIKKLTRLGGKDFPKQLQYIYPLNAWNHSRNKSFFWNLACLTDAIAAGKQAEFYYNTVNPDGTLQHRGRLARVHPYSVVCTNGQYYLICSLGRYDQLLHYRIDRMTEVKMRDKPARKIETVPGYEAGLNLAQYVQSHHFMYGGTQVSVLLRMPVERAGDVLDSFGSQAKMRDLGDGSMEVSLCAAQANIRYFALQFGASGCEVLKPESLRRQLQEDIKLLASRYGVQTKSCPSSDSVSPNESGCL